MAMLPVRFTTLFSGKFLRLGENPYERYTFANKDFLLNAIEYLKDEGGIIEARSKEVKLRLMDTTKAASEETMWQLVNIVLPLLFLGVFGFAYNYWRRRKYAGRVMKNIKIYKPITPFSKIKKHEKNNLISNSFIPFSFWFV